MGCDIHLAVEVRRNGAWHRALPPAHARDPHLVEQAAAYAGKSDNSWTEWYAKRAERTWYDDRNYRVFAVLADVRNTGEIVPIAEPRGLPDDMSAEVRKIAEDDGEDENDIYLGDHSRSWLTLAELQAYPWDGEAVRTGVVALDQFLQRIAAHGDAFPVKVERAPYATWSASIAGPNIVTRKAPDVIAALRSGGLRTPANERTHVEDRWSTPVRADAHAFTERLMPALAELGPPDDVRIVFGFDS